MSKVGIDAMAFYVPNLYVSMDDLAAARGIEAEKLKRGLGLQKMALPDVGEDAATFAANALLNLIQQNAIDPSTIGRVYLGTESAVDGSKPTATYAVEIVENHLADTYGSRSFKNCDILDMTFACVGGVDAMHNSVDWVKQDPSRKAVVIASDLSKYELNSTGEYTQGAGAVAVLIAHEPSIISFGNAWGVGSKSEGDFFKPRRYFEKSDLLKSVLAELNLDHSDEAVSQFIEASNSSFWKDPSERIEIFKEEPVFDGQFSNACYEERITEALAHFNSQDATNFLESWDHLIFHLPYAFHGRRIIFNNWLNWVKGSDALSELETEIGSASETDAKDWNKRAYKSQLYKNFVVQKIAAGELASSEIGNMYTASIFMSLLSLLANALSTNQDITGETIGFIAYGSGSKSKVFEGTIESGWKSKIKPINLFETLKTRDAIDVETYEQLHGFKVSTPVATNKKISLDYIETEPTNYGLRRYSIK
ncbi:hydroxymethylglutaryl-CoA synthase family protein [Winogradskyella aurantiaca]|uniref:hydroxymethylglutaryl-CoA synthase family protein n=1 Tax=Winogradskyella aurantiaca TaxID=2219558 RepID=UPI000E1DD25E|nr:hydroxymethylglutaryl-CoA synthase [Winogradskyella aurantiaca]